MKVTMPQNSTLWVQIGDREFRITHATHMKGDTLFIMDLSPGRADVLYERERTHDEIAAAHKAR